MSYLHTQDPTNANRQFYHHRAPDQELLVEYPDFQLLYQLQLAVSLRTLLSVFRTWLGLSRLQDLQEQQAV